MQLLTHQGLNVLEKYFEKKLKLVLFTKKADQAKAALSVDIRNVIKCNREGS